MKYLLNNEKGVLLRADVVNSDGFTDIKTNVKRGSTLYVVQYSGGVKELGYDELLEFLAEHSGNISITQYRVGDMYKYATLIIGNTVVLKLHTYAYDCMDLVSLYKTYQNKIGVANKVYFDVTYKAYDSQFVSRFDSMVDAGCLLDELEDDNIVKITMITDNKVIASISNFDDSEDIFTLEITDDYSSVFDMVDTFEQFLR